MGSMRKEGPWPDCLGIEGEKCVNLIEAFAKDVRGNVHVVKPGENVIDDFRTDRVWVFVDDKGIVIETPDRG